MRQGKAETERRAGRDAGASGLSTREEDLLTLLLGKQLYGLEILAATRASGRTIGVGSLYPTLHRMERKRLVRSWWGADTPATRGHARRRYYMATAFGARVLAQTQRRRAGLAQWRPAGGRR
jgi:PadR family transcriptional regulator, regulatory protein PadR